MDNQIEETTGLRVLIVDDHDVVAAGMRALLNDADGVSVIATAGSVAEAVRLTAQHEPDVVLMDYRLPDGTGADATRTIRSTPNPPGVVMVTAVADRRVLSQALDAGCCGFLSKNADRDDLLNALHAAKDNDSYFTRDILQHLVHLKRFDVATGTELSDREIEVLQATADGKSTDAIAAELFLSTHTVKNHLRHAMAKLECHTKLDAVVKAVRARLISIEE